MSGRTTSPSEPGLWKVWMLGLLALLVVSLLDDLTQHCGVSFADGIVVAAMGWFAGIPGVVVGTTVSVGLALVGPQVDGHAHDPLVDLVRSLVWLGFGLGASTLRERVDSMERQKRELDRAYSLLQQDLEASRLVQKAFLDRPLPRHPAMRIAVRFTAARGPSGDFYDVGLQGDRLTVCVADVTGKGAPAALVTGLLRGILLELSQGAHEPRDVLAGLHARLEPYLPFSMFVTCFYGVLDLKTGELLYANAGHDPPFVWSPSRHEVLELEGTGFPLGVVEEQDFGQRQQLLAPGDLLLLYTDGLVNSRLPGGGRLGEEPVRAALVRPWAPPEAVLRALEDLLPEPELGPPEDDILLLALQWQGVPLPIPAGRREWRAVRTSRPGRTARRRR